MKLTKEDDNLIKELYVDKKMSTTEIAKQFNVSHRTIILHLNKLGIKRRTLHESQYNYRGKDIPKEFSNYDIMYDLYITQHKTREQLGKDFNCAPHVILRVLKELGIPIRNKNTAKIGAQKGEAHHNWKGGITTLNQLCREYFTVNLTPLVLKRDNYKCQLCGSKKDLHVHHIKHFKDIMNELITEHPELTIQDNKQQLYDLVINDERFLDTNNLITYCKHCHQTIIHGIKDNHKPSPEKERFND